MKHSNKILNAPTQTSTWKKWLWIAVAVIVFVIVVGIIDGISNNNRIQEQGAAAIINALN